MGFFDTSTHTRTMGDITRHNKMLVAAIAGLIVLNIVCAFVFPHRRVSLVQPEEPSATESAQAIADSAEAPEQKQADATPAGQPSSDGDSEKKPSDGASTTTSEKDKENKSSSEGSQEDKPSETAEEEEPAAEDRTENDGGPVILVPLDNLVDVTDAAAVAKALPEAAAKSFGTEFSKWLGKSKYKGATAYIDTDTIAEKDKKVTATIIVVEEDGTEHEVTASWDSKKWTFAEKKA